MITPEQAIEIARARAKAQGWGLVEPLALLPRRSWSGKVLSYTIDTNPAMRGTKTRFEIDANTGAILSEGFLKR